MRSEAYMNMGQWTGLWLAHVTFLDPVMCQVITLTNAVSFVWNKIQDNYITNISSWKKLQGRLQSISAILTQPHWVDISFICTCEG